MNPVHPPQSALWTTKQAAAWLTMHPTTLAMMRISGKGPAYLKISGAVRYRPEVLEAWLDSKTRTNTAQVEGEVA